MRKTSLVRKIVATIAIPSFFTAVLVVAVITWTEWKLSRSDLLEAAIAKGKIVASNSTAALAFGNPNDAKNTLSSLSSDSQIKMAILYNRQGLPFASYLSPGSEASYPGDPQTTGHFFREGALELFEPVHQNTLPLGTLYLRIDLAPLYNRLYTFLAAGIAAGVGAAAVAFVLAYLLQSSISRPILNLAEVARTIASEKNYGIRAVDTDSYPEATELTQSFNNMLDRIQSQDDTLRQSELQFRRAIQNAPIPIAICIQDGDVLELSVGWEESVGFRPASVGNLFDWFRDRAQAETADHIRETVAALEPNGNTADLGEIHVRDSSGGERIWQAKATTIGDFQRGRSVWLLIAVDMTERIRYSQDLERQSLELKRSNQELDDFAYIASHDMKEPLRGIYNNALFLDEYYRDKLGEDGARRLERMQFLCKRLETLIDDLLYYSRIGRQELAIQKVDPNRMVKDIAKMLETTLEESNGEIVIVNPLPPCVCDGIRVQEVLLNLITNALKYNDSPRKTIEVGFRDEMNGHRNVYFVRDNGYGIDPRFHEEVFRIFKRLNAESDDTKGTGSGLTFVKKIVERHNGTVWVESELAKGSTFYFTLEASSPVTPVYL